MRSAPTMTASVLLLVVVMDDDDGISPKCQQHLGWFLSIVIFIFKAAPPAVEEPSLRHLMLLQPPAAAPQVHNAALLCAKDNCIFVSSICLITLGTQSVFFKKRKKAKG